MCRPRRSVAHNGRHVARQGRPFRSGWKPNSSRDELDGGDPFNAQQRARLWKTADPPSSVGARRELGNQLFDLTLRPVRGSLQQLFAVVAGEQRHDRGQAAQSNPTILMR